MHKCMGTMFENRWQGKHRKPNQCDYIDMVVTSVPAEIVIGAHAMIHNRYQTMDDATLISKHELYTRPILYLRILKRSNLSRSICAATLITVMLDYTVNN